VVAPSLPEFRVVAVSIFEPPSPGPPGAPRIAVELSFPRIAIEPLPCVVTAGVIAPHPVAEPFFQMRHKGRKTAGGLTAILRRRDGESALAGAVFPYHDVFRMLGLPPCGRLHAQARHEQSLGVGC